MTRRAGISLAVVGGGSTYTPELIDGMIELPQLPIHRISLVDIDPQRLEVVGALAGRMLRHHGHPAKLALETDLDQGLTGADFVITQIRVGGNRMRLQDESIPLAFNCIGQETVGAGGFACALRNLPALLKIARAIERHCPDAWMINFTNPAGLITEALSGRTRVRQVGLCNIPVLMHSAVAALLGVAPERIQLDYVGLNHLSWVTGVRLDGRPVLAEVIVELEKGLQNRTEGHADGGPHDPAAWLVECMGKFEPGTIRRLNSLPSPYLRYYYHTAAIVQEQMNNRLRAQQVLEMEEQLLDMFRDQSLHTRPELMARRGGALYSRAALDLIEALNGDREKELIIDYPGGGDGTTLPVGVVVESSVKVSRSGMRVSEPLPCPQHAAGLVRTIKEFEILTARAALEGDREAALMALAVNPLAGPDRAPGLFEAIWKANAAYLVS